MKLLGNLLLVIGVIAGALSAATAYLVPVSAPDETFIVTENGETSRLTLAAPAGAVEPTEEQRENALARYQAGEISADAYRNAIETPAPIAEEGEEVTSDLLEKLRAADVTYVRVAEFGFFRWPHWWVFMLSAGALLVGSLMLRAATKAEVEKAGLSPRTGVGATASPEESLGSIRDAIEGLRRDLPGMPDHDQRMDAIMRRLGDAQAVAIVSFIDARAVLINRLGLGAYAELMDRFAAMERQINRCWSAAADGVEVEALECLERAAAIMKETETKMPG